MNASDSSLSAEYAFYMPNLHVFVSNNLLSSTSSYTAKCFTILEALKLISTLTPNKYFIVSGCLHSFTSNIFKSLSSSISMNVRDLLYNLCFSRFIQVVKFLWISSHSDIYGNEIINSLAKSTSSLRSPSPSLIP